ncbi:glycerate kinase, partial [Burkholderia lata]
MPQHPSAPVVVIAPDSFKGSLSAEQVADAIAAGIRRARPDAVVRCCPMADGGEGTLDAMLAGGGTRR